MIWPSLLALLAVVTLVARIVLVRREGDAPGNETVAVAFAPPRAVTPGLSGVLRRDTKGSDIIPAEILDLAVRGVWQVGVQGEGKDKVWFVQRSDTSEPDLPETSRAIYRAVFPIGSAATRVELSADRERTLAFQAGVASAHAEVRRRGWVREGMSPALQRTGWLGLAIAALSFFALIGNPAAGAVPLLVIGIGAGAASQFLRPKPWRYTPEGRRINDELDGLKLYMTMAESDRMKVLQAPDTAERVPALAAGAAAGKGEIAKLHERLLPYAVLFGILPQWSEVVKHDYAEAEYAPDWFLFAGYDMVSFMLWTDFLASGGFDALSDLGDFGGDLGEVTGLNDAGGVDALGGELGGGDLGGDAGGGDGGGLFGDGGLFGGGDGGGIDLGGFGDF